MTMDFVEEEEEEEEKTASKFCFLGDLDITVGRVSNNSNRLYLFK